MISVCQFCSSVDHAVCYTYMPMLSYQGIVNGFPGTNIRAIPHPLLYTLVVELGVSQAVVSTLTEKEYVLCMIVCDWVCKTYSHWHGAFYLDYVLMKKHWHLHQLIQETSHVGSSCSGHIQAYYRIHLLCDLLLHQLKHMLQLSTIYPVYAWSGLPTSVHLQAFSSEEHVASMWI